MIKLKPFFTYRKITLKGNCKCHFCTKIGYENLEHMCEKALSSLYILYHEIILHEKKYVIADRNDKFFLKRLKIHLIKLIKSIKSIRNKFGKHY